MFAVLLFLQMLHIGNQELLVEVAADPETRSRGLTEKKELLDGHGMLFVFDKPQRLFFWMKDTPIPLSIGFFDADQTLLQIEPMQPFSLALIPSRFRAQYALEVPQGWFERNGIGLGTKFSFRKLPSQVE